MFATYRRLLKDQRGLRARIVQLEQSLEAERARSRRREDELVDRVLTASGRTALSPEPLKLTARPEPHESPLNAVEEARLRAFRASAVAAGRSASDGDRVFYAQRRGEPSPFPQPDEPFLVPNA